MMTVLSMMMAHYNTIRKNEQIACFTMNKMGIANVVAMN